MLHRFEVEVQMTVVRDIGLLLVLLRSPLGRVLGWTLYRGGGVENKGEGDGALLHYLILYYLDTGMFYDR